MRISIVVYDISAIDRIKANTYKFLSEYGSVEENADAIWGEDICVEFQKRLIILNSIQEKQDVNKLIQRYLCIVLKGEEVTINNGRSIEYNICYGEKSKLLVTYM